MDFGRQCFTEDRSTVRCLGHRRSHLFRPSRHLLGTICPHEILQPLLRDAYCGISCGVVRCGWFILAAACITDCPCYQTGLYPLRHCRCRCLQIGPHYLCYQDPLCHCDPSNNSRVGTYSSRHLLFKDRLAPWPTRSPARSVRCNGIWGDDRGAPVYDCQHNRHRGRLGSNMPKDGKLDARTVRDGADTRD